VSCRLYQCNCEVKIVPEALFYNPAIPKVASLTKEWIQFRSPSFNANVFNYCSYPFLIHEYHKLQLLQFDFKSTQEVQVASICLLWDALSLRRLMCFVVYRRLYSIAAIRSPTISVSGWRSSTPLCRY
jgi:hypothetical protein